MVMKKLLSLIRRWSPNYIERTKEFFFVETYTIYHIRNQLKEDHISEQLELEQEDGLQGNVNTELQQLYKHFDVSLRGQGDASY